MDRHRVDVGPFCPEAFPTEEAVQELTRITRAVHETVPRRFYEGVLIPSTDGNLLSLCLRSVEYVKYRGGRKANFHNCVTNSRTTNSFVLLWMAR